MTSALTIALDYRPSRTVAFAAAAVVLLASAAALLSGLPAALRVALALGALLSGAFALARFLRPALRRIAHGASGWQLVGDDASHDATLVAHARLGPFIALSWRLAGGGRWHAVLAPDNADARTRRQMVLLLARGDIAD
jgi:hypothetical protein